MYIIIYINLQAVHNIGPMYNVNTLLFHKHTPITYVESRLVKLVVARAVIEKLTSPLRFNTDQ